MRRSHWILAAMATAALVGVMDSAAARDGEAWPDAGHETWVTEGPDTTGTVAPRCWTIEIVESSIERFGGELYIQHGKVTVCIEAGDKDL